MSSTVSKPRVETKAEILLRQVDAVIRNLGDNASVTRKQKCKRKRGDNVHSYNAPVGLEKQYEELHSLLKQGLIGVESKINDKIVIRKQNVSSLLMGPRGHGKSLVLDRCLSSLRQENTGTKFRVVRLNGILLAGHNVMAAVRDICKQLSEIVTDEENQNNAFIDDSKSNVITMREKLHEMFLATKRNDAYDLRTRRTTFHHSLALLDEALQIACIDNIPILIILDELDSFLINPSSSPSGTGSDMSNSLEGANKGICGSNAKKDSGKEAKSDRHLLLYHLLDRVNSSAALVSLVGLTSRLPIYGLFEKRIKSRAEGTSRIVHFGKPVVFEDLVEIILTNYDVHFLLDDYDGGVYAKESLRKLKDDTKAILLPINQRLGVTSSTSLLPADLDRNEKARDEKNIVHDILERHWRNGKSIKWFLRVLSIALTLFSETLQQVVDDKLHEAVKNELLGLECECRPELPEFDSRYLLQGLDALSSEFRCSEMGNECSPTMLKSPHARPSIQEILDLSGSQLAVVISAKRVLARDGQNYCEGINNKVLTYDRMHEEYKSYFLSEGRSNGPDTYQDDVYFQAFLELLYVVFRPAKDHTGGGRNEYHFQRYFSSSSINHHVLKKLPLRWNIPEHDLNIALKSEQAICSSALKDWAK